MFEKSLSLSASGPRCVVITIMHVKSPYSSSRGKYFITHSIGFGAA
jgi:hypothetical protein